MKAIDASVKVMDNNKQIKFEISGEDYRRFKEFAEKHKACINDYPDFTGTQFEFSFIPSGIGIFKTIICSCGERLLLSSEAFGEQLVSAPEEHGEPESGLAAVRPNRGVTQDLLERLRQIRKRPGLFLGRKSGELLNIWMAGVTYGVKSGTGEDDLHKSIQRVRLKWLTTCDREKINDEEAFDLFFEILYQRFELRD